MATNVTEKGKTLQEVIDWCTDLAKELRDAPETMYSHERLEHERRKAWSEGYAAGWKDQECDFPQYTSENPYKETVKIEREGK